MCIDFRDLNKVCPKDCYPLHRIDQIVDSTIGQEVVSLMDVYQGYHQIPLAKDDQSKVSFVTSGGLYAYVVIPFGLKNVEATESPLKGRSVPPPLQEEWNENIYMYIRNYSIITRKGFHVNPPG